MTTPPRIAKVSVLPLKAPLLQPFRTARGEHKTLDNILFALELEDRSKGYGEAAIAPHITGETIYETVEHLKSFGAFLVGRTLYDYLGIAADMHRQFPKNPSAIAAVEMSLFDGLARHFKIPLWKFFGAKQYRLATDITMVIADLKETEEAARKFYRQGFRIFKVKIGHEPDRDYQRVMLVHRLTRGSKIILDANQGYSAGQALDFIKKLKQARIRPILVEQPVPKDDWEGLKTVGRLGGIPVCADESAGSFPDALWMIREKTVPVINIKIMKYGIVQAREIALLAKAAGIKLMIGGMMESSLAMTASAHLAAGMGGFDYIDLDTPFFIQDGFDPNPYLSRRGVYELWKVREGIGIVPKVK